MTSRRTILSVLPALLGAPLSAQTAHDPFAERYAALAAAHETEPDSARLHRLFALVWDEAMWESPTFATAVGYPEHHDRWTDLSPDAIARRRRNAGRPMTVLETIDRDRLSPADRLNYDLLARRVRNGVESGRFPGEFLQLNQMGGVQQGVPGTIVMMPTFTVRNYEDIVARLNGVPTLVDQTVALLQRGVAAGITPPEITLREVPQQVLNLLVDDPLTSPLMTPFRRFPSTIPEDERERLLDAAREAVTARVFPAYRRLHAFLEEAYLPGARTTIGWSEVPDGEAWYAMNVRLRTTTDLAPAEIHELGLREVDRLRGEMDRIIEQVGFEGSFAEFLAFLRTDPQFFFDDPEALLAAYRDIAKRADPELVKLFGRLPRLPYGVIPIPPYAEKSQTTAYYSSGSIEMGRPGYFFANTYALDTRPTWEMEALTLHEAVPGHHLQIAIAQELEHVPDFRRLGSATAFVEGWGLYAESLGEEMGFYQDPYAKFGQLTYEMWRAIRLVLDTGLHAFGWNRDQAIEFFQDNSAKTEHDITVEVDRYIVWPGQALAYKIGELTLKELRADAEHQLGVHFDVRAFHDEVLGQGALPLDVLEERMRRWILEQRPEPAGEGE